MATGTLRYWAAAREAAGCSEEPFCASTLDEALRQAVHGRTPRFAEVLAVSSYLVDDAPVGARGHQDVLLHDGSVVEVLPPFAGG